MKVDTGKQELELFTSWYMAEILEALSSDQKREMTSKQAYDFVAEGGGVISRASVIKGLQEMKIAGFLTVRLESGKGGYHEIYRCPYTKQEIMAMVLSRVIDAFPDETASRVLASRVK